MDFNDAPQQASGPPTAPAWTQQAPDRQEVRDKLLGSLEGVLGYLYPAGFADPKGRKFYIGSVDGEAGESLSVSLQGSEKGLWYDFATGDGGDIFDLWRIARRCNSFREVVQDAAEYTGAAINTPRRTPKRKQPKGGEAWGAPTKTYRYEDPTGKLLVEVARFEWEENGDRKKVFRPWDVAQRKYTMPAVRPLYNLPNIASAPEIILCEGEKAADALIAQNLDATTALGGSNAPLEATDWTPLRGRKVIIWPDNDDAGKAYAERLKPHLEAQGALAVSILTIPATRPQKWDAADAADEDLGALIHAMRGNASEHSVTFSVDFWDEEDLTALPRVDYIYNRFYARGYTSVTAAPPKVGKSLLGLIEAVDMASGRGLLTGMPQAPVRVYYYNAEDDIHTIKNRVGAILKHYGLTQADIRGRLAVHSGVGEDGFYLISGQEGEINERLFQMMEEQFIAAGIDCAIFDPLQDLSRSPETNEVLRILGGRLRRFASKCQTAIGLIHHTRKMQAGVKASIDDMRGGSALRGTARFNRLLVPMSEDEAVKAGLSDHRAHFQVGDIEGNLAPPSSDYARWYEKVSVTADNGESVGVIAPWQWPDAFDGISPESAAAVRRAIMSAPDRPRENQRAAQWVGHLIGDVVGIDTADKAGKAKVKTLLSVWLKEDVLRLQTEYSTRDGREITYVVAGRNNPAQVTE